jgi:phosphoglycerate dehydrogenase-like enzyme
MSISVALLDDFQGVGIELGDWQKVPGATVVAITEHIADEDRLVRELAPYEVIVAMRERTPFGRRVLERLGNLKLLVTTGMANDSIDLAAARELGVTVCGTAGLAYPTAELTIGLMIDLVRFIAVEDANLRRGGWQTRLGMSLSGRTLGVIGLGRLGAKVAQIAQAMDMNVISWSTNLTATRAEEFGTRLVGKDELFESSDIVSVHLKLSDRTRGLIGARELALLGPDSYLINTSRGPIVDEAALVAALSSGAIAGAALDVFDVEPLPPAHPLRSLPNVLLTPHIGYVTRESYEIFYRQAREDLEAFLSGSPVRVLGA